MYNSQKLLFKNEIALLAQSDEEEEQELKREKPIEEKAPPDEEEQPIEEAKFIDGNYVDNELEPNEQKLSTPLLKPENIHKNMRRVTSLLNIPQADVKAVRLESKVKEEIKQEVKEKKNFILAKGNKFRVNFSGRKSSIGFGSFQTVITPMTSTEPKDLSKSRFSKIGNSYN